VSLVGPDERKLLKDIEKLIGKQIERMTVEGVDLRAGENDEPDERPARRPNNQGNRPPKRGGGNNAPGRNQQRRRSRGGNRGGNRSGGGGGGQS
jgi:ATP-dependent RNA helicase RhlE